MIETSASSAHISAEESRGDRKASGRVRRRETSALFTVQTFASSANISAEESRGDRKASGRVRRRETSALFTVQTFASSAHILAEESRGDRKASGRVRRREILCTLYDPNICIISTYFGRRVQRRPESLWSRPQTRNLLTHALSSTSRFLGKSGNPTRFPWPGGPNALPGRAFPRRCAGYSFVG